MENGSRGHLCHLSAEANSLPSIRGHFILACGTQNYPGFLSGSFRSPAFLSLPRLGLAGGSVITTSSLFAHLIPPITKHTHFRVPRNSKLVTYFQRFELWVWLSAAEASGEARSRGWSEGTSLQERDRKEQSAASWVQQRAQGRAMGPPPGQEGLSLIHI